MDAAKSNSRSKGSITEREFEKLLVAVSIEDYLQHRAPAPAPASAPLPIAIATAAVTSTVTTATATAAPSSAQHPKRRLHLGRELENSQLWNYNTCREKARN